MNNSNPVYLSGLAFQNGTTALFLSAGGAKLRIKCFPEEMAAMGARVLGKHELAYLNARAAK